MDRSEKEAMASAKDEGEDAAHCEHCEKHSERIAALEKHVGISLPGGFEEEASSDTKRHEARVKTAENLSRRKRS
jgi:D-arabinose 1-dehydrogenase-like Zn-dependent alcohol dehydrogenase